jgi:hypothetical protein
MYWSAADVAREHVWDLHRHAERNRLVAQASVGRRHRIRPSWWQRLMGLASLVTPHVVRPAQ